MQTTNNTNQGATMKSLNKEQMSKRARILDWMQKEQGISTDKIINWMDNPEYCRIINALAAIK